MKRIFLAAFVLLVAGAALYAEGAPERPRAFNAEPVTVTGKVTISEADWPSIANGSKTYTLLYPRFAILDIPVKNGDTITVTGYVVPGPRWADAKAEFLRVTQAEINGKTYIGVGPGMGRRGRFGRANGYCGDGWGPRMGWERW